MTRNFHLIWDDSAFAAACCATIASVVPGRDPDRIRLMPHLIVVHGLHRRSAEDI